VLITYSGRMTVTKQLSGRGLVFFCPDHKGRFGSVGKIMIAELLHSSAETSRFEALTELVSGFLDETFADRLNI
jgi:hypothetical protein